MGREARLLSLRTQLPGVVGLLSPKTVPEEPFGLLALALNLGFLNLGQGWPSYHNWFRGTKKQIL